VLSKKLGRGPAHGSRPGWPTIAGELQSTSVKPLALLTVLIAPAFGRWMAATRKPTPVASACPRSPALSGRALLRSFISVHSFIGILPLRDETTTPTRACSFRFLGRRQSPLEWPREAGTGDAREYETVIHPHPLID
jgi:hypothetical protein